MSNTMRKLVKKIDVDLSTTAKFVLFMLADYHNDKTGKCYPSHATIAKDINATRETVARNVKILIGKGLISVVNRSGGQNSKYVYFHLDQWDEDTQSIVTENHNSIVTENDSNVTETPKHCDFKAKHCDGESHEQLDNTYKQLNNTDNSQSNDQTDFERWWCVYPKECDKSMACHAPSKLENKKKSAKDWTLLKPNVDQLIADVEKRKASDRKWLAGFAPLPENYLKSETWKQPIDTGSKSEDRPYNAPPRDDDLLEDWASVNELSPPPIGVSYYDYRQLLIREQKSNLEQFNNSFKEDLTEESVAAPVDAPTPTIPKTNGSTNADIPAPVDGPYSVEQIMRNMAAKKSVVRKQLTFKPQKRQAGNQHEVI